MFAVRNATKMIKPAQRMLLAKNVMFAQNVRCFSFGAVEKASQKLSKALESEIKYENENYSQLEDIETFLNDSGFKFTEAEGGMGMKLSKEIGDKIVEIEFEAR
jgi:hypothetical protein